MNVQSRVDIQMGTLSKAAGLAGGFIAGSPSLIELLVNRARSFIYSTAPPPALAHAARYAIELIRSTKGTELRAALQKNIEIFTQGTDLPTNRTPIIPIVLGGNEIALTISAQLKEQGFLVPAIRYPTVPRNRARLRVSLSAMHSSESILQLRKALEPHLPARGVP
jgi:7-keto-8-aminopelargonate synthetase-like enzyme